jgi:hypothetical protein
MSAGLAGFAAGIQALADTRLMLATTQQREEDQTGPQYRAEEIDTKPAPSLESSGPGHFAQANVRYYRPLRNQVVTSQSRSSTDVLIRADGFIRCELEHQQRTVKPV